MSSFRKKPQLESPRDSDAPVLPPPEVSDAKLPDPVVDAPKLAEQPAERNPVEAAVSSAIRDRLREMERAEQIARQQPPQSAPQYEPPEPQPPQEPQDPLAHLPPRVQRWCQEHPELATDPERAAQVQYCHHVACRETGEEFTDPYFDRMEAMLFGRPTNGNGHAAPSVPPRPRPAPVQRQQYAVPVSAPPAREAPPSMVTGRPSGSNRITLTAEEAAFAKTCKVSPTETDEEAVRRYALNKAQMLKMKAAGAIPDGQ